MAPRQGLRERDSTHKFGPRDLPEAESPAQRGDLSGVSRLVIHSEGLHWDKGHPSNKPVNRVVVLPASGNVATACDDGRVRVFEAGGDGTPLLVLRAHAKSVGFRGLAALGEHVLASSASRGSKLHTWDARTGECVDNIDLRRGALHAIAAVGDDTLVTGLSSGAVVFIQHTRGRQLAEVARREGAHSNVITDIAWQEDVMVTASWDKTARVWSLSSRNPLAVLRGHRHWVMCAAVTSRYIATGSRDNTLRLYSNDPEFPLISVLDGLHADSVTSVQFIGADLMLSGSEDRTMCFTAVSADARPIARLRTESSVLDTVITRDGRIAWVGQNGAASVSAPPRAVADAAKEHALATFPSVSSAIVQHEPQPPLQVALVDAHAGRITAGEACRNLLNADRCSASISEWWCGHQLLMLAVKQGEVEGKCGLDVGGRMAHDYWFENLYHPTKNLKLGRQDREQVYSCLAAAKKVGVIEGTQAIIVAIEARLDLDEEVTALRVAQKSMLKALSNALLEQAKTRAELERMHHVQNISLLMNAVFSVVPLGAGAASAAGVTVLEMAPDLLEGILDCAVGLQGAATPPLVDRFVRHTARVIASWEEVPVEAGKSIAAAAKGLGMTWEEFRDMILTANAEVSGTRDGRVGVEARIPDVSERADAGNAGDACDATDSLLSVRSRAGDPTTSPGIEAEIAHAFGAVPRGGRPDAPMDGAVAALRSLLERVGGAAQSVGSDDVQDALEAASGVDALRASPRAFRTAFFALAVPRGLQLPRALPRALQTAFRSCFCDAAAPEALLGSRVAARVLVKVWREACAGVRAAEAGAGSPADPEEGAAVSLGADDAAAVVATAAVATTPELDVEEIRAMLQEFADGEDRLDVLRFAKAASHVLFEDPPVNTAL